MLKAFFEKLAVTQNPPVFCRWDQFARLETNLFGEITSLDGGNNGLDVGRESTTTRVQIETFIREVNSMPASIISPKSAQSLRFRALRSILWMMTPCIFPSRSSLSISLKTGRPVCEALSRSSNQRVIVSPCAAAYRSIAVRCSGSDTLASGTGARCSI